MIVNQTAITEADQEILRALLRRQPIVIAARIFVALFALYLLTIAGLTAYAEIRWHNQSTFDLVFGAGCLVVGGLFLYRDLFLLKQRHPTWRLCAISSDPAFERSYGKRADKKRRFYNGRLECVCYIYD